MQNFRTAVPISPLEPKINHLHQLMVLGSCFSDNIGNKLQNAAFHVVVNPFGTLFNPISISNSLNLLLTKEEFTDDDIFKNGWLWSSWAHSTLFSHMHKYACLTNLNLQFSQAKLHLQYTDYLLLTFGTAWVYTLKSTGEIVANCHKVPAKNFLRKCLGVEEIVNAYTELLAKLKAINPELQVILTVSPVRHFKDGAHANTISKSILHLAVDQLRTAHDFVHYFPAFEIQMDELRDYRFYTNDMLHPSTAAVDYIWKKFQDYAMLKETKQLIATIEDIRQQEAHKSIHPNSKEDQDFKAALERKKQQLQQQYPYISL